MAGLIVLSLVQAVLQPGRQLIEISTTKGRHRDFFMRRIDRNRLERWLLSQRVSHIARQTGLGPRRTCFDLLRLFHQLPTNSIKPRCMHAKGASTGIAGSHEDTKARNGEELVITPPKILLIHGFAPSCEKKLNTRGKTASPTVFSLWPAPRPASPHPCRPRVRCPVCRRLCHRRSGQLPG